MVRKRLSDLVREEAQKAPEAETAQAETETAAEPATEDTQDSEPSDPSAESTASSRSTSSRGKSPTKAELEAIVSDLQAKVKTVQQERDELHNKIADLQDALEAEKKLQQKLQADLKKSDQLKEELEKAKELILKLSEANAKPAQSVSNSQSSPLSLAQSEETKPKSKSDTSKLPQLTKNSPSNQANSGLETSQTALRKVLRHPIEPTKLPQMSSENDTKLSNDDIGWVD